MKKIFYVLLIAASGLVFGQTSKKLPLVLVDGMIAPATWTNVSADKNFISVKNLKGNLPTELAAYKEFAGEGVTTLKVKENMYDKVPLRTLNQQFNLADDNPVMVDGRTFTDTSTIILGQALLYFRVIDHNGRKMVSVDTVSTPESRRVVGN